MLSKATSSEECTKILHLMLDALYEGFSRETDFACSAEEASIIITLLSKIDCPSSQVTKYCVAMMGLALHAQNYPLLSLLLCIMDQSQINEELVDNFKCAVVQSNTGYSFKALDLQRTYEYLLTHESPDSFYDVLACTSVALKTKANEALYEKANDVGVENLPYQDLIILFIRDYCEERSWKLLSKYSLKVRKYTLNFIANYISIYKFKDTSFAIGHCIRVLNQFIDESLPNNHLLCGLWAWVAPSSPVIVKYNNAFFEHIVRNKSFANAPSDVIELCFAKLSEIEQPSSKDLYLALEIAKQRNQYDLFALNFFNTSSKYSSIASKDLGFYVRFTSAFSCVADESVFASTYPLISQIRKELGHGITGSKARSALLWVDDMVSKRDDYQTNSYFLTASAELLATYPSAPSTDLVYKWITPDIKEKLPDFALLRNWINTFGDIHVVGFAEKAMQKYWRKKWLPNSEEERRSFYTINCFIAEKHILFFGPDNQQNRTDFMRKCMTYYVLKKLSGDAAAIPSSLQNKIHDELKRSNALRKFQRFTTGVDQFVLSVRDEYIAEMFLYCGISNYWDILLDKCLFMLDRINNYAEEIQHFIAAIDYRPFRRRLLQMYTYPAFAALYIANEVSDEEWMSNDEIKQYYNKIISGELNYEDYRISVVRLIDILQPSINGIISNLEADSNESERKKNICGVLFALKNKYCNVLKAKLCALNKEEIPASIIQTIVEIQYAEDVQDMIMQMCYETSSNVLSMIDNAALSATLGNDYSHLCKSLYYFMSNETDAASHEFSKISSPGTQIPHLYHKLQSALRANDKSLITVEDFGVADNTPQGLVDFSFTKSADPEGATLTQLITDYYTPNLYDIKGRCILAQKIYHLLLNGTQYEDSIRFLYDWGFDEIARSFDIEDKASILFELIERIEILKDNRAFKKQTIHNFTYILQELDFSFLVKNFGRISQNYKTIRKEYYPFDNCECYDRILFLLSRLLELGEEVKDPRSVLEGISEIKAQIIAVHVKYPQNRFANNCISFVDRYAQQIRARGSFDVRILNDNNEFDGIVFYSVRNVGFELASNLVLTFSIEDHPECTSQVSINAVMPMGLRPNQVFAGEYSPSIQVVPGDSIGCSITVEYSTTDSNGVIQTQNYTAIDTNKEGRLHCIARSGYSYKKDGGSGYITQYIEQPDFFVGRKDDLNSILGTALRGQNVLLFGTNGTGKSSILHYLFTKALPDVYSGSDTATKASLTPGHLFTIKPLVFDEECTEKEVITAIVSTVSTDFRFRSFFNNYGDSYHRLARRRRCKLLWG